MVNTQRLAGAWEKFIKTGILDADKVRPVIAESWQRCRKADVNPYCSGSRQVLKEPELTQLLNRKKDLIAITRPFMENVYNFVAGSGFIVILSDENGNIIETLGDKHTQKMGLEINLIPGSSWLEEEAGTNGVGTALALAKPVQVSGEEHYCQKIHTWTCSAAPIFDCNGQMAGILQMSGPSYASHLHTLGMVVAAVKAIEEQLRVQQKNRELKVVYSRMNNIFNTMSDGVIIVDSRGIIQQVNPSAEGLLEKSSHNMEGLHLEEVFQNIPRIKEMIYSGKSFSNTEVLAESGKSNIHCLISGKAIQDDRGFNTGGAIIINPINKIKKLVNRFSGAEARFSFTDILGKAPVIQEAVRVASLAAENDSNVLLEGESGTGKEVFAQAIHNQSRRQKGPFVALNCAAIPRELMGSELFGYVEGAFTGAYRGGRPGKFELASGGTLFLDEIGDMTMGKQGSLLRAIQERKIVRIGDNKVIPVDVRIICATNKSLHAAVEKGNFREDLYYRLKVISINLPPLRKHLEDIPLLFEYFLEEISKRLQINIKKIDPDLIPALKNYDWPGNVRELQNVIERMVCIARENTLRASDLPVEILSHNSFKEQDSGKTNNSRAISIRNEREKRKQDLAEIEQQEIIKLLAESGGNISQVAREMGISRNTLYRKIKLYNIAL